jgi:parallel beta-helix repeat protein
MHVIIVMMNRIAATLLFLLAASALSAQDYGVRFQTENAAASVPLHTYVGFGVVISKPEGANAVLVEVDIPGDDVQHGSNCVGTKPLRCTLPPSSTALYFSSRMNAPGTFTATARVISVTDPNPDNDQASWTFDVVDAPSLRVSIDAGRYDPGTAGYVWVSLNNSGAAAKDVVLTMTLPEGGTFAGTDGTLTCDVAAGTMICTLPELGPHSGLTVRVQVAMPDRLEGGRLPFAASVTSRVADFDPADDRATGAMTLIRHLVVDNTNDEGAGSLRQALLDAQQLCAEDLCRIDFRIAGSGENGRFVIRPRTELPEVQGSVSIDGATQTRFGGDTNPDGPELVIDGSEAPGARGLLLGGPSCEMHVTGLAIENFSAPAIAAYRGLYDFQGCRYFMFPNTRIERNHLSGNYRGIAMVGPGYATITDNVIRDNARAGIFADRSSYLVILRNRITGNGASGIFLNDANPWGLQGAVVEGNVISGNAEWGIARVAAGDVSIRGNSIFGNRYLAIDAGLDLETPNAPEDRFRQEGVPNKPVLISAQYDPASGKTRVHGRLDSEALVSVFSFAIDVYSSASLSTAGHAEAEQWLAALEIPVSDGHAEFVVEVEGDLRGRWITATSTRRHIMFWDDSVFDTSEVSNAIRAQ